MRWRDTDSVRLFLFLHLLRAKQYQSFRYSASNHTFTGRHSRTGETGAR